MTGHAHNAIRSAFAGLAVLACAIAIIWPIGDATAHAGAVLADPAGPKAAKPDATQSGLSCAESTTTIALPDPISGRHYEIYVSMPSDDAADGATLHPVVFMADGGRALPKLLCLMRSLPAVASTRPVIVGLSTAKGEDIEDSRRRDYTPVARQGSGHVYGGAGEYGRYLRDVVIPYVERHDHTDPKRRIFWGHSYGGLLGATILLTDPALFQTYILGSPSLWFADHAVFGIETAYAAHHPHLDAHVLMYVGGNEVRRLTASGGHTQDMAGDVRAFIEQLASRHYAGLDIASIVIPHADHVSSIRPGILWSLPLALNGP